jgi:hypothetical protein
VLGPEKPIRLFRLLGSVRHLDDPLLGKQHADSNGENMSVRSGDKGLTGIIARATICLCSLNLSYFLAEEGAKQPPLGKSKFNSFIAGFNTSRVLYARFGNFPTCPAAETMPNLVD